MRLLASSKRQIRLAVEALFASPRHVLDAKLSAIRDKHEVPSTVLNNRTNILFNHAREHSSIRRQAHISPRNILEHVIEVASALKPRFVARHMQCFLETRVRVQEVVLMRSYSIKRHPKRIFRAGAVWLDVVHVEAAGVSIRVVVNRIPHRSHITFVRLRSVEVTFWRIVKIVRNIGLNTIRASQLARMFNGSVVHAHNVLILLQKLKCGSFFAKEVTRKRRVINRNALEVDARLVLLRFMLVNLVSDIRDVLPGIAFTSNPQALPLQFGKCLVKLLKEAIELTGLAIHTLDVRLSLGEPNTNRRFDPNNMRKVRSRVLVRHKLCINLIGLETEGAILFKNTI